MRRRKAYPGRQSKSKHSLIYSIINTSHTLINTSHTLEIGVYIFLNTASRADFPFSGKPAEHADAPEPLQPEVVQRSPPAINCQLRCFEQSPALVVARPRFVHTCCSLGSFLPLVTLGRRAAADMGKQKHSRLGTEPAPATSRSAGVAGRS